jgi:hypothetical protein
VTDRWIAYLRRRADAQVKRANLAAMQHGLLPAGWVYGLNDQRQAEYDEQRRILLERHKHLYREPVSGPDGVAIALWYAGAGEYPAPLLIPNQQWPGSPPDRLAAIIDQYIRVMNRIIPTSKLSFAVQTHAMSGPPAVVIRHFQRKQDAAAFTRTGSAGAGQRRRGASAGGLAESRESAGQLAAFTRQV